MKLVVAAILAAIADVHRKFLFFFFFLFTPLVYIDKAQLGNRP